MSRLFAARTASPSSVGQECRTPTLIMFLLRVSRSVPRAAGKVRQVNHSPSDLLCDVLGRLPLFRDGILGFFVNGLLYTVY